MVEAKNIFSSGKLYLGPILIFEHISKKSVCPFKSCNAECYYYKFNGYELSRRPFSQVKCIIPCQIRDLSNEAFTVHIKIGEILGWTVLNFPLKHIK